MTVMANPPSHESRAEGLASRMATGVAHRAGGTAETVHWALPEEVPVALQINSESYTVMMATPADLRDFAIGLVMAEGIVTAARDITGVLVMPVENGMTIDVAITRTAIEYRPHRQPHHRRALGLRAVRRRGHRRCVEAASPADPPRCARTRRHSQGCRRPPSASADEPFEPHCARRRLGLGHGEIGLVREDVGRHNALDKLIGALSQSKTDTSAGFVLMTSRCSFELVQKCALSGIGALVTVSAPTALALDLARKSGMYLAALRAGRGRRLQRVVQRQGIQRP